MNLQEEIDKLDLIPLLGRIIVKEKGLEMVGSIIIPHAAESMKPTEGTILAVGGDVTMVEVGDNVFYGRYSGTRVDRDKNTVYIMNEEDIIAKVCGGKNGE